MRSFAARHQAPVWLVAILGVIALVSLSPIDDSFKVTLTEMFIRVIVVVGLYVFIGNSGIISFGQVGFMCIGAYAAAWATAEPSFKQIMLQGLPGFLQDNQYPFLVAIAGALVLPALVALCLGIAIMRLSGTAASIATFAFLMIVNSVYSNWDSVTAGVSSIIGIPTVVGPWTAYIFAILAILVAYLFQISRFGLMLRASRDDDVAARASAVHIVRMRLIAFVLSAAAGRCRRRPLRAVPRDPDRRSVLPEPLLHHHRHAGGGRHVQPHRRGQRRHRGDGDRRVPAFPGTWHRRLGAPL